MRMAFPQKIGYMPIDLPLVMYTQQSFNVWFDSGVESIIAHRKESLISDGILSLGPGPLALWSSDENELPDDFVARDIFAYAINDGPEIKVDNRESIRLKFSRIGLDSATVKVRTADNRVFSLKYQTCWPGQLFVIQKRKHVINLPPLWPIDKIIAIPIILGSKSGTRAQRVIEGVCNSRRARWASSKSDESEYERVHAALPRVEPYISEDPKKLRDPRVQNLLWALPYSAAGLPEELRT